MLVGYESPAGVITTILFRNRQKAPIATIHTALLYDPNDYQDMIIALGADTLALLKIPTAVTTAASVSVFFETDNCFFSPPSMLPLLCYAGR